MKFIAQTWFDLDLVMGWDIWAVLRDGLTVRFKALSHQIAPGQFAETQDPFEGLLINRFLIIKLQKILSIESFASCDCIRNVHSSRCVSNVCDRWPRKNEKGLYVTIGQKLKVWRQYCFFDFRSKTTHNRIAQSKLTRETFFFNFLRALYLENEL